MFNSNFVSLIMVSMLYSGAQSVQILVSTGDGIFLTDVHKNLTYTLLSDKYAQVHFLDYHYKKSYLYLISDDRLKRMHFNQTKDHEPRVISLKNITEEGLVRSVAVDWIRDRLYWTKSNHHGSKLMESNLSGRHAKHINPMKDLERYHSLHKKQYFGDIVVDPDEGLLFFVAARKNDFIGSIIRINLEGPFNLATIQNADVRSIAIDAQSRRLFVLLRYINIFYSCDYHGKDVNMMYGWEVFPLSISENNIYYVYQQRFIHQLHDESKSLIGGKVVFSANMSQIYTMKVFDRRNQLPEYKYDQEQCRRKHCSHGCQINTKQGVFCTCPVELELNSNGIICEDTEKALSTSSYDSTTINYKRERFTNSLGKNEPYNSSTQPSDQNPTARENKSISYWYTILISCFLFLTFSILAGFFIYTSNIKRNNEENQCSVLLSQVNIDEEGLILEM